MDVVVAPTDVGLVNMKSILLVILFTSSLFSNQQIDSFKHGADLLCKNTRGTTYVVSNDRWILSNINGSLYFVNKITGLAVTVYSCSNIKG